AGTARERPAGPGPAPRQPAREAPAASGRPRGLSRALRRLGLRSRHERQTVEHDRIREALEPDAIAVARGLRGGPCRSAREAAGDGARDALQPPRRREDHRRLTASREPEPRFRLGIRENLSQFSLLVLVNALVGAMVGMERSILPALAEDVFHLGARTAILSFILVFGV